MTSERHHRANALPFMHQIESGINFIKWHGVGDHLINMDLSFHVPVDDLGHIGASASAPEGSASPGAPGNQLKGPSRNFLPRTRNADDAALPPAFMAAL